ncbi:MAG TPA: HAMP domain-containing sensor histidine kinase [Solirubrobacteraceae bacterium]|nr:HAMP domain-containing sensor histidine kinase [Solirubrobacteraceae bacterium]
MKGPTRLNRRITQVAVGQQLPYRTVRVRLTVLYGGLFLVSGAALMAIAYALLVNAGFVFSLQNGGGTNPNTGPPAISATETPLGLPGPGATTHPSAQTMAHWRGVARCMRRHGLAGFPDPTNSFPSRSKDAFIGQVSDRDGALLAIPAAVMNSPRFTQTAIACGFMDGNPTAQENRARTQTRQQLLVQSGIALAAMSVLSLALGWLMAGRVLQPLEDAFEAQRQFVANASHELRAPLTRQRALIEVALASPEASVASLRNAHERALASEQHLEQLIDALLALARGQAGIERRERLDLAALISQAMLARESQLTDLELDVRLTLDPAPTVGDPRLVERLVANLIDNAMLHNTPGGHVEIVTGTQDRHAFVSIANTGPTVPPEQIQRLFQPFQRLGGIRTHHNSGHGLGLSIVQAIAHAHGAELSARPRPEGGLTIDVSFPPALATRAVRWISSDAKQPGPRFPQCAGNWWYGLRDRSGEHRGDL